MLHVFIIQLFCHLSVACENLVSLVYVHGQGISSDWKKGPYNTLEKMNGVKCGWFCYVLSEIERIRTFD